MARTHSTEGTHAARRKTARIKNGQNTRRDPSSEGPGHSRPEKNAVIPRHEETPPCPQGREPVVPDGVREAGPGEPGGRRAGPALQRTGACPRAACGAFAPSLSAPEPRTEGAGTGGRLTQHPPRARRVLESRPVGPAAHPSLRTVLRGHTEMGARWRKLQATQSRGARARKRAEGPPERGPRPGFRRPLRCAPVGTVSASPAPRQPRP